MEPDLLDSIRHTLQDELGSIDRQLAEYGASPGEYSVPVDDGEGFADSAHATTERSERLSLVEQLVAARADVTRALARLAEGKYGTCERCGSEIAPERLEALPTASLCVDCKRLAS